MKINAEFALFTWSCSYTLRNLTRATLTTWTTLTTCQGKIKSRYNEENPTFKYETIELLVCIYKVIGELVFKYGISGCSRCLTLETKMNPLPSKCSRDSYSQAI